MISANSKKRDSARMLVRRYVMDLIYQHGGEAVLLPSNKDLAAELGIARSTAQLELKLLLKEGFVTTRPGVGTFTVPRAHGSVFQAPLIGILDGDGKIIYEPFYRVALKSHIAMELGKMPTVIQEIRLFSERENDQLEELRSIRCDALVCIAPDQEQEPLLRRIRSPGIILRRGVLREARRAERCEEEKQSAHVRNRLFCSGNRRGGGSRRPGRGGRPG